MGRCWVFFHAHPDDEVLLTGGTMARAARAGVRVVLVMATAGERGLTGGSRLGLGAVRESELRTAARVLGCTEVRWLGYEDSGSDGPASPGAFAAAPVEEAAERLAAVLRSEAAELLTVYDPVGGYGHVDHVQVHRVGRLAARQAGTPRVLEATVDRDALLRGARIASRLPGVRFDVDRLARSYTPASAVTHRVDVRCQAERKRRALAAHVSQRGGGPDVRLLALLVRLPLPVFRRVLGTEWFIERPDLDRAVVA